MYNSGKIPLEDSELEELILKIYDFEGRVKKTHFETAGQKKYLPIMEFLKQRKQLLGKYFKDETPFK